MIYGYRILFTTWRLKESAGVSVSNKHHHYQSLLLHAFTTLDISHQPCNSLTWSRIQVWCAMLLYQWRCQQLSIFLSVTRINILEIRFNSLNQPLELPHDCLCITHSSFAFYNSRCNHHPIYLVMLTPTFIQWKPIQGQDTVGDYQTKMMKE